MKYGINTIDDFEICNKTVLIRVDMNSPLKKDRSGFTDITRIEGCAPTIKELSDKKAKLVVMTHQGSDVEYHNYYHTELHARELSRLIGKEVKYIDDVCGPAAREKIKNLEPGEILLLDNVRFMAEEMTLFETKLKLTPEEQARTQVVQKLAPLADLYICDAFAAAHRAQPTLLGFEELLPSAMGRLFEREYTVLSDIVENPERPCVFVLGGAKIQDAFLMMSSVLKDRIADKVLAGGLVGNIMLVADGVALGEASSDFLKKKNLWEYVETSRGILEKYRDKIILPVDLAYVGEGIRQEVMVKDLPLSKELLVDIGHQTVEQFKQELSTASTIFFNGPMGVFEEGVSEYGTRSILEAIAKARGFSVIGGGDSITAINKYELNEGFSYVCTGGGALIRFLSGEELSVVKALKKAAIRNKS
jgi:phosphoglycerate kinase